MKRKLAILAMGLLATLTLAAIPAQASTTTPNKALEKAKLATQLDDMKFADVQIYIAELVNVKEPTPDDTSALNIAIDVSFREKLINFDEEYTEKDLVELKESIELSQYDQETKEKVVSQLNDEIQTMKDNNTLINGLIIIIGVLFVFYIILNLITHVR